jgi:hypothetical protein
MSRLKKFLIKVLVVFLTLAVIGLVLFLLQVFFGLFNNQVDLVKKIFSETDAKLSSDVFTGISVGTVALLLVVGLFPVLMKGVDNRQYFVGLRRGVISSFVFYLSDNLYIWLGSINRFYMILSMVVVIIITFILIEALALSAKKEDEVSFRTDLTSAVVAGLIFGVLLKLFMMGSTFFKTIG